MRIIIAAGGGTDYFGAVQTDPETAKGVSRHRKHIEVLCC